MTYKTVLDKTTGELKKVRVGDVVVKTPANLPQSIDITDKAALRELAMKELVAIVQANAGDIKGIAAVRELLDRVEGKAMQIVHQTNETTINIAMNDRRERARQEVQSAFDTLHVVSKPLTISND